DVAGIAAERRVGVDRDVAGQRRVAAEHDIAAVGLQVGAEEDVRAGDDDAVRRTGGRASKRGELAGDRREAARRRQADARQVVVRAPGDGGPDVEVAGGRQIDGAALQVGRQGRAGGVDRVRDRQVAAHHVDGDVAAVGDDAEEPADAADREGPGL